MRYNTDRLNITEGIYWNKDSSKDILKYAVGALLYCPATHTDIADIILNKKIENLKSICICLEDSIQDSSVEYAESILIQNILKIYNSLAYGKFSIDDLPLIFIRVRNATQLLKLSKNLNTTLDVITGFVLPKFDSQNFDSYTDAIFKISDKNLYIMPIIETSSVLDIESRVEELVKIKEAVLTISKYILNIRVGGNDFCNQFGFRRDINHTIYDINVISSVLSDIVNIFGREYIISAPVWEYFKCDSINTDWAYGLQSEIILDKLNGFIGKTCIHPSQLDIVQQSYSIDYRDYENAKSILNWNDNMLGVQKGIDGRMNEVKVHTRWAERTMYLAKIYGIRGEIH